MFRSENHISKCAPFWNFSPHKVTSQQKPLTIYTRLHEVLLTPYYVSSERIRMCNRNAIHVASPVRGHMS